MLVAHVALKKKKRKKKARRGQGGRGGREERMRANASAYFTGSAFYAAGSRENIQEQTASDMKFKNRRLCSFIKNKTVQS